MSDCLLALCTCPDEASAARVARALVEERLAACVSRVPGLTSTYRWEGRVEEDAEHLLVIKTTTARLPALRERIVALHPYDVPELIALPFADGLPAYLAWLRDSVA
jgi:periplasmic divalent cation tolerance protein